MRALKTSLLTTSTLAGVAALLASAYPSMALAQDTPPDVESVPAATEEEGTEVETLVVTGTRLRQTEFTSPLPIQVVTAEQAELKGVNNTAQMLQTSTVASGSPQVTAAISAAFVTAGGPGAETVSLRGLGAERTLVLVNGRRGGPAGTRGSVAPFDLNVLPQSAIGRAEILKDGASSIYGSDAVAGVVNLITRKTDGGEISAFASVPFLGGGEEYQIDGRWGKTFGALNFSIAFDYNEQKTLRTRDRSYTRCAEQYLFDAATGERADIVDPRTGRPQCRVQGGSWAQLWVYEYGDNPIPGGNPMVQFDYTGDLARFLPQHPGEPLAPGDLMMPPGWFAVNYDPVSQGLTDFNSPYLQESSIIPERQRGTIFAEVSYDVSDTMTAYSEFLLSRRETRTDGYRQFWTYLMTEDFLDYYFYGYAGAGLGGDPFSEGWSGNAYLSPTIGTDHFDAEQIVDYGRVVAGLRGNLPDGMGFLGGWRWDVFLQYSKSDGQYIDDVILDDALTSQAMRNDAFGVPFFYPNSVPRSTASCVGHTLPISNKPCIDLNFLTPDFMRGNLTAEEREFLFDVDEGSTEYTQAYIEGFAAGEAFQLPAGPLGVSVGFHLRRDEINDVPGPITQAGNSWGLSASGVTAGEDTTREVFGELAIPLIKDAPYIELLDLALSGRYTDVESYGSNNTYRVALNWRLNPVVRFRFTQGTSFRAPALFNQFLANETSFLSQRLVDPCINVAANLAANNISQRVAENCLAGGGPFNLPPMPDDHSGRGASATMFTGGGSGLKAETSEAFTAGLVWTPQHLIDLSVAIDYFEIEINDELADLGGLQALACYSSENFPNDPVCGLFTRNPTLLLIDEIQNPFLNIAEQKNRGIDVTARYRRDVGFGDLTIEAQSTWQLQDETALFPGFIVDSNGDVGNPDWTGILNVQLDRGDTTFFWGVNAFGKASEAEDIGDTNAAGTIAYKVHTEFTAYHSLSMRQRFQDDWTLLVGMANVFDEEPPALTTINLGAFDTLGTSAFYSQYDFLGRRAFVNVKKTF